jgi:hypothetical protein
MADSETLQRFSVWMLFGLAEKNRRHVRPRLMGDADACPLALSGE